MKKFLSLLVLLVALLATAPLSACQKTQAERSKYTISATYDKEKQTLTGTVDFTYVNTTDNEIASLKFNLWGNAYRDGALYSPVSDAYTSKAYYNGESYGYMKVSEVTSCSGWEIGGEDENILTVNLLTPTYPQDTAELTITYTLNLANVNHRTGVTEKTVNLGNFYPTLCAYTDSGYVETPYISCGDPFVSDVADYEVTLTYPAEYVVAASGKQQSESVAGSNKIARYTLSEARDFAFVLSAKFQQLSCTYGDTEIIYYYYDDANPQTTLNVAADSVKYFSETFGSYSYPTLSVVQTGFCMGGMEYPALTMISDSLSAATNLYTIVHENAHQWWYAMVGSDQVNCGWQDEGLAEYSSLMFFENNPTYGFTRTGMLGTATKAYRAFYSVYNQIFGDADTTMNRSLAEFISDYEYVNIAYNKGLLLFESVRAAMGDEKFVAALKEYFEGNKFTIASPEALIAPFVKRADVEGIFTSYLDGKIII
jgi:aminopeptidase N